MNDDIPRRARLDRCTPAELAIYAAMEAVEALPADVRLTDAGNLLQAARHKVADYVDGVGGSPLPGPPPQVEQCICAAIRLSTGELFRGHRHDDAIRVAGAAGVSRDEIAEACQGFITSRNRYVGREEGAALQRAAGIVSAQTGQLPEGMLFSEDLYLRPVAGGSTRTDPGGQEP